MKILIGLGVAVVTIIGVMLALPFLIDLKKYQDQYKPALEEALNRKVDFQDIRLTLWPRIGARVEGFTILDDPAFGSGPFASLASLDVAVQVRPLLSGHVEVDEITLRNPVIAVIKNQKGVLNVSTVGRPGVPAPETPSRAPIPSTEGPLKILGLLAVDRVSLIGGTITYRDLSAAAPLEYVLQDLGALLTSVRLGQTPQVHVETVVQPFALPVVLDGRFGPLKETTDLEVINFHLALGTAAFDITGQTIGRDASLTISSPVINTAHLPVALPLQQPVEIKDLRIAAEVKGQDARLQDVSFQLFEGQVKAQGMVTSGPKAPPFSLTAAVQGLQLGPAVAALSSSPVRIRGSAGADLRMQGRGVTRTDLTSALEGTGHVMVKDGILEGANLLHEAVSLLKIAGITLPDARATAFSTLEADVAVKRGVASIEHLLMDSHDFQATGGGTIGFDQTLDLLVNLHLSPALTQTIVAGSPVAKLAMNEGRLKLPLTIAGTVQAPRYGLELKHLTGKVQQQVQKKVEEAVSGLLKGTTKPEDLRQQGKELLKGLFRQ
ncbi:MAG: AsmA family protein [Nitrospiraceae bacterium]|nr:AsmA family protein [Nitrospiraceae bacterium]